MAQHSTHTTQKTVHPKQIVHPRRTEIFLHLFKTLRLLGALFKDQRVPLYRKAIFGIATVGLLVLLFIPDIPTGLTFILPIIGTILGVPIEAGVNWTVFALLVVSLMRVFPAAIVSEHYQHIFHKHWEANTR